LYVSPFRRVIVTGIVVMPLRLRLEMLSRKPKMQDEVISVSIRVLIWHGPAEGIADPAPHDRLRSIADQPGRAKMVGMDVEDDPIADRGNGDAAEVDQLFDRIAGSGVVNAEQLTTRTVDEVVRLIVDGLRNPLSLGIVDIAGDDRTALPDLGKPIGLVVDVAEALVLDQVARRVVAVGAGVGAGGLLEAVAVGRIAVERLCGVDGLGQAVADAVVAEVDGAVGAVGVDEAVEGVVVEGLAVAGVEAVGPVGDVVGSVVEVAEGLDAADLDGRRAVVAVELLAVGEAGAVGPGGRRAEG
jgi:hypothetical protein